MYIKPIFAFAILILVKLSLSAQLSIAHEISENDLIPEGIACDEKTGDLKPGKCLRRTKTLMLP